MSKRTADQAGLGDMGGGGGGSNFSIPVPQVSYDASFTEFFNNAMSAYVSTANPTGGAKARNENQDYTMYEMLDFYKEHPGIMDRHIIQFAKTIDSWMLAKFPPQFTEAGEVLWTEYNVDSYPLERAARGTLSNQLVVSKVTRSQELHVRSNGFLTDIETYKKEPWLFEAHKTQVISNFMITSMLCMVMGARTVPTAYNTPVTRIPESSLPKTVREADAYMREHFMEITRDDSGIESIAKRAQAMFAAQGEELEGFIIGKNEMGVVNNKPGRFYSFISGMQAMANRNLSKRTMGKALTIDFHEIPNLSSSRNNDAEALALSTIFQAGSIGTHVNACQELDFGKWTTDYTDFGMCSWDTNGNDKYKKSDTTQHSLLFQACDYIQHGSNPSNTRAIYTQPDGRVMAYGDYIDAKAVPPGQLNRAFVREEIKDLIGICEDTRTDPSIKNQQRHNVAVKYDVTVTKSPEALETVKRMGTANMYPIAFAAEVDKWFASDFDITHCYKTTAARIFKDLTRDEIDIFFRGIRWMKKTNELPITLKGKDILEMRKQGIVDADVVGSRDPAKAQYIGMLRPNKWGGVNVVSRGDFSGYGNMAGVLTLVDDMARNNADYQAKKAGSAAVTEALELLPNFLRVFKIVFRNANVSFPNHIALDPRMCPYYHIGGDGPNDASPVIRAYIAFGYHLTNFTAPAFFYDNDAPVDLVARKIAATRNVNTHEEAIKKSPSKPTDVYGLSESSMLSIVANCNIDANSIDQSRFQILIDGFRTLMENGSISSGGRGVREEAEMYTGTGSGTPVEKYLRDILLFDASKLLTGSHLNYTYMYENISSLSIIAATASYDVTSTSVNAALATYFANNIKDPLPKLAGSIVIVPLTSSKGDISASSASAFKTNVVAANNTPLILGQVTLMTVFSNEREPYPLQEDRIRDSSYLFTGFKHIAVPRDFFNSVYGSITGGKGITMGDTLTHATPYINPRYPLVARSVHLLSDFEVNHPDVFPRTVMDDSYANPMNVMLSNGYPYSRPTQSMEGVLYINQFKTSLYNENAYWAFQVRFKEQVPFHLAQLIYFPLGGNPFDTETAKHPISHAEERWIKLHGIDEMYQIGGKLSLFSEFSTPSLVRQMHENIDTIHGAKIIRPWETQRTNAAAAVAKGQLGTFWHNQPDDIMSPESIRQVTQFSRQLQFGTTYQFPRRIILFPHSAGSDLLGGCGKEWFDELIPRPAILNSVNDMYIRELRRYNYNYKDFNSKCNFAVITGMSGCVGEESHDQSADLCGFPDRNHYVGVLHDCEEFDNMKQDTWMWEGVAWFTHVHYPIARKKTLINFPYENYNLNTIEEYSQNNTTCHPNTIRITDKFGHEKTLKGRHIRGVQIQGLRFNDNGNSRIGVVC